MSDAATPSLLAHENAAAWTPRAPWLVAAGHFFFKHRNAVFPAVMIPLLVILRPWPAGGSAAGDLIVDALGLLVGGVGQALRVSVIGFKYVKRGGKNKEVYADTLVTGGFFEHGRNPLYNGNLLIVFGFVIVHGNPVLAAVVVPLFLLIYCSLVAAEETYLAAKFGPAFDAYCARVPRWWMNPLGLRASTAGMVFAWRRVLVKEYNSLVLFGLVMVALLFWERFRNPAVFGGGPDAADGWVLGAALALTLGFWVVVRVAKKSGRLVGEPDE